jgi:hypothetical protein
MTVRLEKLGASVELTANTAVGHNSPVQIGVRA